MKILTGGRVAVALAAVALAISVGAVAYGAGGSETISVCVHHRGGALYKAKSCRARDEKLSWAKQGPRGLRGPQGPRGKDGAQGPAGAKGAAGAVAAYSIKRAEAFPFSASRQILSLSLPAGNFVVRAKTTLETTATTSGYTFDVCSLTSTVGSFFDRAEFAASLAPILSSYIAASTLTMETPVSFRSPASVRIVCIDSQHSGNNFQVTAFDSSITAVQVNEIH